MICRLEIITKVVGRAADREEDRAVHGGRIKTVHDCPIYIHAKTRRPDVKKFSVLSRVNGHIKTVRLVLEMTSSSSRRGQRDVYGNVNPFRGIIFV